MCSPNNVGNCIQLYTICICTERISDQNKKSQIRIKKWGKTNGVQGVREYAACSILFLGRAKLSHRLVEVWFPRSFTITDNVAVYMNRKSGAEDKLMKRNMQNVVIWLVRQYSKLGLMISKTNNEFLVFSLYDIVQQSRFPLNNTSIKRVSEFKKLGVIFNTVPWCLGIFVHLSSNPASMSDEVLQRLSLGL